MYSSWPCPLPDGSNNLEMLLGFDQARPKRLMILPPVLEELNKFRRQTVEIMRRLDLAGVDSFCPDLPGCNESSIPFALQDLDTLRTAAQLAAKHINATHIVALRSGCWLAPLDLPGWLYAPAKPAKLLRSLLKAHLIAAREAGEPIDFDTLEARVGEDGLALGGIHLSAKLIRQLQAEDYQPSDNHVILPTELIGGSPLWLRAENDEDPEQADALANAILVGLQDA